LPTAAPPAGGGAARGSGGDALWESGGGSEHPQEDGTFVPATGGCSNSPDHGRRGQAMTDRNQLSCGAAVPAASPGAASAAAAREGACTKKSCPTSVLHEWMVDGGPLPHRLAAHIAECPACATQVRAASQVHAGFALLSTQCAPPDLTARANARALRFLRRAARATAAAQRLLRIRPGLTRLQRASIQLARL